jgi:DNA-directed RNA polymerase specialized sigma24 family protein
VFGRPGPLAAGRGGVSQGVRPKGELAGEGMHSPDRRSRICGCRRVRRDTAGPPRTRAHLGARATSLGRRASIVITYSSAAVFVVMVVPMAAHPVQTAITSEAAFEAFARDCSPRLFGIALAILIDHGEAEDAVQEALWKAWKARARAPDGGGLTAWMVRICVNQCLDRRRFLLFRGFRRQLGGDHLNHMAAGVDHLGGGARIDIARAFAGLSPRQRTAIALRHHYGYSLDECADLMGCRVTSVRTHLRRGLATLRKELSHA